LTGYETLAPPPELAFRAQETAEAERRNLDTFGEVRRDRMAVDWVGLENRHGFRAARKGLASLRDKGFTAKGQPRALRLGFSNPDAGRQGLHVKTFGKSQ
jgi:hypothetical protein